MVTAVIVMGVIAALLGGYLAFDTLRDSRKQDPPETEKSNVPDVRPLTLAPPPEKNVASDTDAEQSETVVESSDTDAEQSETVVESSESAAEPNETVVESSESAAVSDGSAVEPRFIVIKYSRSFTAKLIQSDEQTKRYYSQLKNALLCYEKVKSKIAWKSETFRVGRKTVAKLRFRGKTLALCLALDPEGVGTKYAVENIGDKKTYRATPCCYRIKNEKRLGYASELINGLGLSAIEKEKTDYAALYPYEQTDALIRKKLIKVLSDGEARQGDVFQPLKVRAEVKATEVDKIMTNEAAASLIERSTGRSDTSKKGVINIDTLSQYFESGDAVTLDEIKKRVKGFNEKITYIKVLARGALDKPLTVEADNFSIQAVKMILLTGGKAIRKTDKIN